jgi:catalase
MPPAEAARVAGINPDYHNQELFDAIARGEYPVWNFSIQVMEPEQAEKYGRAVFDITKVWPHKDFPLIPVGKMTLNKNVSIPQSSSYVRRMLTGTSAQQLFRRNRASSLFSF